MSVAKRAYPRLHFRDAHWMFAPSEAIDTITPINEHSILLFTWFLSCGMYQVVHWLRWKA
jgi:hypothetical protein